VVSERPESADENGASRRSFLTKLGVGAAAAWTAPVLLSSTASAGTGPGTPGPAPDFVVQTSASNLNDSQTFARAGSIQNGDLLLAIVAIGIQGNPTITAPADWTLVSGPISAGNQGIGGALGTQIRAAVYSHVAATGEAPYTFSRSTGDDTAMTVGLVAYSGAGTLRIDDSNGAADAGGTAKTFPAVTPTGSNRTIVRLGAGSNWPSPGSQAWTAWPATNVRITSAGYAGIAGIGVGSHCVTVSDNTNAAASDGTINQNRPAICFTVSIWDDV
jgi:hypothetical protein